MPRTRWIIFRRLLLVILLGTGASIAARKGREPANPDPAPAAPEAPTTVATLPAAPALFASTLPVAAQATPAGLANLTAQGCNACHAEVHDAWAAGPHARAWNAPAFRVAMARVGESTACTGCHLPLQNQHPRLAKGYVQGDLARPEMTPNPAWDPSLMSEGVTCAACHVRDGQVLTARPEVRPAPHPLAYSEELGQGALCATCHQLTWPEADQPFYDTWGEWQRSPQGAAGIGCQDCHMPPRAGLATASRFAASADHGFPADTARALSVLVRTSAPEIQRGEPYTVDITLQNTGAGHHVPTGSPFKAYRLVTRLLDSDGKDLVVLPTTDLARQVEDAPPWNTVSDTRLAAGEERVLQQTFTVDQRKRAGRATLELTLWRLDAEQRGNPRWAPPSDGTPLLTHRIPLPVM